MITPAQLAIARAAQLSIMLDRVLVEREGGPIEGEYAREKTWTAIFAGPGRLQRDRSSSTKPDDFAGQDTRLGSYVGAVPWSAPLLQRGDRVTITASLDPALKGRRYTISGVEVGSTYLTARRYHAEEDVR